MLKKSIAGIRVFRAPEFPMSHLKAGILFLGLLCLVACGSSTGGFGDGSNAGAGGHAGMAGGVGGHAGAGAGGHAGASGDGGVSGDAGANADAGAGGENAASHAPTVVATTPSDGASDASSGVQLTAIFSKAMAPSTISALTFTLKQGANPIAGTVTFDLASNTATFSPDSALALNLVYTATISTGAKDSAGLALAADYIWSFTTSANATVEPPTVVSTLPGADSTGVSPDTAVSATFSGPMDPTTLDATTFTLKQGATSVPGGVQVMGNVATFTPTAALTKNLVYTAKIASRVKDVAGFALAADYTWSFTTAADANPPVVTGTNPADLAVNVPLNSKVTATFSRAMAPATLSTTTFVVKQGAANVSGTVTVDAATNTALFTPSALLTKNVLYTATITTGAKDLGGVALATDHTWSFTTATVATPPTVIATTPLDLAVNVSINNRPTATFSGAMDSATITNLTFTLKHGNAVVLGVVTFSAATNTATFTPGQPLELNMAYTATITTGAKDSSGTALAQNYTWSFTTSACGQLPVVLASAANFAVLAGSTVTSTGLSKVTGDLGVSPGTAVTGFPPGILVGAKHAGDPTSAQGIADLTTAYNSAAGRKLCPVSVSGNLGGMTLAPGLYKSTTSLAVSSGDLTLDAQGDRNAIFIFQIASTLTTTSGRQVILKNGARSANIFWQVGSSATIGTTSVFQGTIMADQAITLQTGANLNGRALARIAAVSLDGNTIVKPAP